MNSVFVLLYVASIALVTDPVTAETKGNVEDDFDSENLCIGSDPTTTSSTTVPKGTKPYVSSLRNDSTIDGLCTAILISPMHLLTGVDCIAKDIRYASIGSHYSSGTEDGELIKIVAILCHPNISESSQYSFDFVVLQLQTPSSFKPIALGASDIKDGDTVTKLGWNTIGGEGQDVHELQRDDVELISNEECAKQTFVDESMMCSRPTGNQTSCSDGYGGPLIVERPEGDVLVGMVSSGADCSKPGYPSYYSRISIARTWIETMTRGNCYR